MAQWLIGVDAGTSIVKSVLFSTAGEALAVAKRPLGVLSPQPGAAEQDPGQVWQAVRESLAELVQQRPDLAKGVIAIGVTGQGDGTWLVDAEHNPVGPAILWLDGRSTDWVRRWEADGTAEAVFAVTGSTLDTSLQSAQLRWLKEAQPERLKAAHAAIHAKDWVFLKLTGRLGTDPSEAAHTFWDHRTSTVSDELLRTLEIEECRRLIPPVVPPLESRAPLSREAAESTGLPAGIPVVKAPFDVVASAIGTGCIHPGDIVSIIGSANIHGQVMERPIPPSQYTNHLLDTGFPKRWIRMMGSMTGTLNLDWAIKTLVSREAGPGEPQGAGKGGGTASPSLSPFVLAEREAGRVPPGADGLIYLPFIDSSGERSPFVKPTARSVFFGLQSSHGRGHLLRAVYEGVAMSARDNYVHFPESARAVRIAGGGRRSEFWMQVWANVTGRRLEITEADECGALGAALTAAVAVGAFASLESAVEATVRVRRVVEPDPAESRVYDGLFRVYQRLCRDLGGVWDFARDIREEQLKPGH